MKLKKVLCMAALSAAVALSGIPVSGAVGIAHAEETQISNLDEILRSMYVLYTAGDYASMYALDTDAATKACVETVRNSGSDRYVIDIDGNTKAMMYVPQDGGYWWYFGQMENNLRQGNGTTIICSSTNTEMFTGTYAGDMPNGNGKLSIQFASGALFGISGNFHGAYLNGVYQVDVNWVSDDGEPCSSSLSTVYANNHFQSVEGWNLDIHPSYENEGYTSYDFWGYINEHDLLVTPDIKNGSELFALGIAFLHDDADYASNWWSKPSEYLNEGLDIFLGSANASVDASTPPAAPAASPEAPTVTTPAPAAPSGTYVVERGDNLSKIAQKVYGDKKLWRKIYDANSNVIKDDYIIWANQILVIPQ